MERRSVMRGRARSFLALALLAAALFALGGVGTEQAAAQTPKPLVSNLGQPDNINSPLSDDHAQAFTTGAISTGYKLTSVDFEFEQLNDAAAMSKMTLTIRSDSSGRPGAVVATLVNPSSFTTFNTDTVLTFTTPGAGVNLAASTTYWMVLDSQGLASSQTLRLANGGDEDSGGYSGFSISNGVLAKSSNTNFDRGHWIVYNSPLKLRINGSVRLAAANSDGSFTVTPDWPLAPQGMDHGERFRLLFVTSTTGNATPTDIAVYDGRVRSALTAGSLDEIKPYAHAFKVVGSTQARGARVHLDLEHGGNFRTGISIHWLDDPGDADRGLLVADDYEDFCDREGSNANPETWWKNDQPGDYRNENGESISVNLIWTGSTNDCRIHVADDAWLGGSSVAGGRPSSSSRSEGPLDRGAASANTETLPVYGISPVFVMDKRGRANDCETRTTQETAWTTQDSCYIYADPLNPNDRFARIDYRLRTAVLAPNVAPESVFIDYSVVNGSMDITDPALRRYRAFIDEDQFTDRQPTANELSGWRTLLSNIHTEEGGGTGGLGQDHAQAFTTPANAHGGHVVYSVAMEFAQLEGSGVPSGITGAIYTDSSGAPGTLVGTLQNPTRESRRVSVNPDVYVTDVRFTAPAGGIAIEGGATYWFVLDVTSSLNNNNNRIRNTTSLEKDPSNLAFEFPANGSVRRAWNTTGAWTAETQRRKIRIDGAYYLQAPSRTRAGTAAALDVNVALGQSRAAAEKMIHDTTALSTTDPKYYVMVNFRDGGLCQPAKWGLEPNYFGWFWGQYPGSTTERFTAACLQVRLEIDLYEPDNRRGKVVGLWVKDNQNGPDSVFDPDRPRVKITGGGDVTEGGDAVFTISANPPPNAAFDVSVTVGASGDYGVTPGSQTVTIPTTGSATLKVTTTGDASDEPDGSVTATLNEGAGYTLGAGSSSTVAVLDDDAPELTEAARAALVADVRGYAAETSRGATHVNRWKQVLLALGEAVPGFTGAPMTAAEAQTYAGNGWARWDPVVPALTWLEANPPEESEQPPTPEVNITASSGGTEGGSVSFTLTANPAPTAGLDVSVTVAATGDYGVTPGSQTVTIPSTGSATLTLATDDDAVDEADGSVTLTLNADSGYTVGSLSSETVAVLDDDEPPAEEQETETVDLSVRYADLIADVRGYVAEPNRSDAHRERWNRVLVALGVEVPGFTGEAMTASEAATYQARWPSDADGVDRWRPVAEALTWVEANPPGERKQPPPTPVVSIAAGSGITEGASATFTLTATPKPASSLSVQVTVSASGSYGVTTGTRTVTIPASGSATLSVATTGDSTDEPDGSVTATLVDGAAYDLGSQKTGTVAVSDDDDPTPVVSISRVGGGAVTEGGSADFRITATPAPSSPITVKVSIGSNTFGASGPSSVTVSGGSQTFTVTTVNDSTDEPNSSVAVSLGNGSGYTVGSPSSQNFAVNDDDDPPVITPLVSISAGSGIIEGGSATFTLTATPKPASSLSVQVMVSAAGGYGVTTGTRTVTIPASGSVTLSVATTGDSTDEPNGSVTATLVDGAAYDLGSQTTGTVAVSDDDDPTPVVSISAGGGITEGGSATFTLSATPSPTSPLAVQVRVGASGDYGVTTGTRTVTIPASGSATLTVATTGDSADEADGSVTATLVDGAAYDLGAAKAATVSVSDDDDPPPGNSGTLTVSVEHAEMVSRGEILEFTISLSEAAQQDVTVSYRLSDNKGMIAGLDYCALPADGQADAVRCWDLGLPRGHNYRVGQLTIAEGEDAGTLSIWIPAGAQVPGKAWVFVSLTDVEGASEITRGFAGGVVNE